MILKILVREFSGKGWTVSDLKIEKHWHYENASRKRKTAQCAH